MHTRSLLTLLRALNPDDLLTELSRACGVTRWVFAVREKLLALPSEATDEALLSLLTDTWWALPQEERAEALQLTPPLALLALCWRSILAPDPADAQVELIAELVDVSAQYQARHGAPVSIEALRGLTAQEALTQLRARLERDPVEERAERCDAQVQIAWRELQGLRAREELERL